MPPRITCCAVVCLLVAFVHAGESGVAERVRALLIAQELKVAGESRTLTYRESVTVETQGLKTERRAVQWRIRHLDGAVWRWRRSDDLAGLGTSHVVIERPNGFYYAVYAGGKWSAYTTMEPSIRYDPFSTQELFSAPLGNKEAWIDALRAREIIDCSTTDTEIVVVLAFIPAIATGLRDGTLKVNSNLQGMIGWRCCLARGDGAWRLRSVEQIETTRIRVPDRVTGAMTWIPHPAAMDEPPGRLADGSEYCVTKRVTFEAYLQVAGYPLPTRVTVVFRALRSVAEIDQATLEQGMELSDAVFDFKPPDDFGPRGMHTNLDNEETTVEGVTPEELAASARDLAEKGRAAAGEQASVDEAWSAWSIVSIAAASLLVGFCVVWFLARRRSA